MNYQVFYYVNGNPTYRHVFAHSIAKVVEGVEMDHSPDAVWIQIIMGDYPLSEKLRDEHEADLRHESHFEETINQKNT